MRHSQANALAPHTPHPQSRLLVFQRERNASGVVAEKQAWEAYSG